MGRIVVYCQPGARRTRVAGTHDGKPKVQLKAPPIDGEANAALVALMAELAGVPKSAVRIEAGAASRTKRVRVDGVEDAVLLRALLNAADAG